MAPTYRPHSELLREKQEEMKAGHTYSNETQGTDFNLTLLIEQSLNQRNLLMELNNDFLHALERMCGSDHIPQEGSPQKESIPDHPGLLFRINTNQREIQQELNRLRTLINTLDQHI